MIVRDNTFLLLASMWVYITHFFTFDGTNSLTNWSIKVTWAESDDNISLSKGLLQDFVRKIVHQNKGIAFFNGWQHRRTITLYNRATTKKKKIIKTSGDHDIHTVHIHVTCITTYLKTTNNKEIAKPQTVNTFLPQGPTPYLLKQPHAQLFAPEKQFQIPNCTDEDVAQHNQIIVDLNFKTAIDLWYRVLESQYEQLLLILCLLLYNVVTF
jgi:hypothetical protein